MAKLVQLKDKDGSVFPKILREFSAGGNGYARLSDGLIIQWGNTNGTGYRSFPKPFPNACLIVISDGMWASGSNPAYKTLSGIDGWDKNGFTLGTFGYMGTGNYGEAIGTQSYRNITPIPNFAGQTRWLAIGY